MIRTLRGKLIAAAMASLVLVMGSILGVILLANYRGLIYDADRILALLAENQGRFPELKIDFDWENLGPRRQSPELRYELRYFSVLLDATGELVTVDTGKIAAVDQETAVQWAKEVMAREKEKGFYGTYRYLVSQEGEEQRILFLDDSSHLFSWKNTLVTSLWVSAVGLLGVLLLLFLLSGRIIKPVLEGYEKQRRFITDAGHELKTPIAIIQADAEVLALETGEENSWLQDIQSQVKRMASLTNDLIYLSRMEEDQGRQRFLPFSLSELVTETAQSFQGMAKCQKKRFSVEVQPLLTLVGEEKRVEQLVSILLDNALKYAPAQGEICVALVRQGKYLKLTVENTAENVNKTLLENMFDRFYRGDSARNAGGYGIGLSIAQAVVQAHRGRITASAKGADRLLITVLLPRGGMPEPPKRCWRRRRKEQEP